MGSRNDESAAGRSPEATDMSGYSYPTRADDPVHTVRAIGRMAQMILELRDEYVNRPRADILQQIDQRLFDIEQLHRELETRMANAHPDEQR
jgi:hypothetical protein